MTSFPSVSNYAGIFDTLRLIGPESDGAARRTAGSTFDEGAGRSSTIELSGLRPAENAAWSEELTDDMSIEDTLTSYESLEPEVGEASIRLKALLASQQLGIQSLSIANADARAILRLFQ